MAANALDVLPETIGTVVQESKGKLRVTTTGQETGVIPVPRGTDVGTQPLADLRRKPRTMGLHPE